MRNAPPVMVPVGRFVWGWYMAAALAALSMGVFVWAWLGTGASPAQGIAGLLVWVCAACLSWAQLGRERLPPGELAWDGAAWRFEPQRGLAVQVEVAVVWDVQVALLLRVQSLNGDMTGPRYAWLHDAQAPVLWHGCRCAVFGRDIL